MAHPDFVSECPICLGKLGEEDVPRELPNCSHGLCTKCLETLLAQSGNLAASAATSDNSSSGDSSDDDSRYDGDHPQAAAQEFPDFPPDLGRMEVEEVEEVRYYSQPELYQLVIPEIWEYFEYSWIQGNVSPSSSLNHV